MILPMSLVISPVAVAPLICPQIPPVYRSVGGDEDIVAGFTKLGERVAGNTKLE
jgi:hypothetical protein